MKKKILIADDELHIRNLLELQLKAKGFEVLSAKDGEEALAMAQQEKPDLILLDIMMPKKDGPTTAEELREDERTRDIPIVFLTSLIEANEQTDTGHRIGGNLFLAKPFEPETLFSIIDRLTEVRNERKT